jgi:predicted Zn-dependent protease
MLMQTRRYAESLAQFQKILARDPNFKPAHYKLSMLYANNRQFGDAVNELRRIIAKPTAVSPDARGFLELSKQMDDYDRSAAVALAATMAGDRDQAFQYLEKAYTDGDTELLFVIRYPALDPLRSDPRFKELMQRLELPE